MCQRKRIVWVTDATDAAWKTGGERYDARIRQYLQRNGWEVVIPDIAKKDIFRNIFVRHLINNWRLAKMLCKAVKPGDIIVENSYWHSRLFFSNILLRFFKRVRIVAISHHLVYHDLHGNALQKLDRILEGLFFRLIDIVVTVSDSTRREIVGLGIFADKIIIIPNGFDLPAETILFNKDLQRLHFLFVGTCYERKGIEYLLAAFRDLGRNDVVLDLVGNLKDDPEYSSRMKELTNEWKIQDRVVFHGRVPEDKLWELYAKADIFVLPSLWEGFGVVLLEAMALGLPIIATDVGAISDIVKDDDNGILIPPRDSNALRDALERLVDDREKRNILGKSGRARMEQHLTWDNVGKRFDAMLNKDCRLA